MENTKNGQLVITRKVRFTNESEASSTKPGNDKPMNPREVTSKTTLAKKNDSNIELHLIRQHDHEGKQRKLPCFGKKRIIIGDSQLLRITESNKSNQTDLKLPHP